ncbi:hypothetical protein P692DRAFT_201092988 [Suillus brevipes Sb2]|nr:hypothetical protein P692DRAFT_201092988 [Suillus brevipes Sb2]
MSSHDDKEELILIEHQYEHNIIPNGAAPAVTANEAAVSVVDGEANFIEMRSTGFRDFVLTSELLRVLRHLAFDNESDPQTLGKYASV